MNFKIPQIVSFSENSPNDLSKNVELLSDLNNMNNMRQCSLNCNTSRYAENIFFFVLMILSCLEQKCLARIRFERCFLMMHLNL